MQELPFETIRTAVLKKLEGLDATLTYHNIEHTLDVLEQCERIAGVEGITDPHSLYLLKVAALYHDAGFLSGYTHHEDHSYQIFLADTAVFPFSAEDKAIIKGLIDATRLPQQPQNLLEEIICDADLDYLGRADFPVISDTLRIEFLHHKVVTSNEQWDQLQHHFLLNHRYFTASSVQLREPVKQQHIQDLP